MSSRILKRSRDRSPDDNLTNILAQLITLHRDQATRDAKRDERESRQNIWQWVQLAIAVATIAGVVAAFIFGYTNLREQEATLSQGYQNLKQQQQAAAQQDQGSRYSSISQAELDLDTTIADHPRLISCFEDVTCNAHPALTADEIKQATVLASYVVDFYQYLYDQLEDLGDVPRLGVNKGLFVLRKNAIPGISDENWVTWSETIVGGFQYSRLVCDALEGDVNAYEQEFVHAVAVTHVCPSLKDPGQSPWW